MRLALKLVLAFLVVVGTMVAAFRYWVFIPAAEPPALDGRLAEHALVVGGVERHFAVYRPAGVAASPAAVLVLHGSRGDGRRMRRATSYGFDLLADRFGFIVIYPDSYATQWNDCRAAGDVPARRLGIDDVSFLRDLVAVAVDTYGVDRRSVFAAGLSNGGQMGYRLALEAPDLIRGVAAIAASLPTPDNSVCRGTGAGVPVMVINGTEDPVNPFAGGKVTIVGPFGNRGEVLSARDTANRWASLAGYVDPPFFHYYPDTNPDDGSVVSRTVWADGLHPEVALIAVEGGGHTIPGPGLHFPRLLGAVNGDFPAVDEIWRFFARELERDARLQPADKPPGGASPR